MDLANLLADTLTARGYEVEEAPPLEGKSGATYAANLVATREGKRLLVDVLASKPVDGADLEALQSVVDDTAVDGALLLALADEAQEVGAPHEGVEVWPRPRVAAAVGDRVLEGALDEAAEAIGPSPDPASTVTPEPEDASTPDASTPGSAAPATAEDGAELLGSDMESTPQASQPDPTPATADQQAADPSEAPAAHAGSPASEPEPTEASSSPAPAAEQPEPAPNPEPEPAASEPATASQAPNEEPEASSNGQEPANQGPDEFLSPEEMAQRAAEMAKGDGPEDGDAELLTDDPEPTPEPTPEPQDAAQGQASGTQTPDQADPQQEPQTAQPDPAASEQAPTGDPGAGGQDPPAEPADGEPDLEGATVFEDADAALLPSEPKRPDEDAEASHAPDANPNAAPEGSTAPQQASPSTHEASTGPAGPLAAAAPAGEEEDEAFLSGGCVEPRVGEQEARHVAEGAVFEVDDVRLELLPFHVFDYACRLEGDGTTRDEDGRVWVSAQSGAVVGAPDEPLVEDPGAPHERFKGSMPAKRAVHEAEDHLLDNLERREELREDHSETAVIERVTLSPKPETLSLDLVGKAYAPRWRVEGRNGTVFVDALTGDLVSA